MGLFCEVNAGVLATALERWGCIKRPAAWDVELAEKTREVKTIEQHEHGILEQIPAMAVAFLLALHWIKRKRCSGTAAPARAGDSNEAPPPLPNLQVGSAFRDRRLRGDSIQRGAAALLSDGKART